LQRQCRVAGSPAIPRDIFTCCSTHCRLRVMRKLLIAVVAVLTGSAAPARHAPGYHVVHRFVLGGDGGWDYLTLDTASRRLYIARSTRVMVIDADSGTVVGEIPNTPGVHG